MDNQLLLIADEDKKNLEILKENLEAAGFLVITVTNGKDAWDEIQKTPPRLILTETNLPQLSGYQLMERLKTDPNTSSIPLIFLTKQREVQQRIRAFEMGAKDYLMKPLHVKEVIAHIRMILRRLESRKLDQIETHKRFSGRLDELNLADLIESFGIERKTGILTLNNGRRNGQVFFREGSVVNASLHDFKMEQAVYQMFAWKHGYFNMIFRDVDVAEEISISNLGLLLQGMKRLEIREKLLKQLPPPQSAFFITPTFKSLLQKKQINDGANEFTKLLDGNKTIEQIIDDSNLDDLIVLKRLVRLYQQGFIEPTIMPEKKTAVAPATIEIEEKVAFISQPAELEKMTSQPQPFAAEQKIEPNGRDHDEKKGDVDKFWGQKSEEKKLNQFQSREKTTPSFTSEVRPSLELRRELRSTVEPSAVEEFPDDKNNEDETDGLFKLNPAGSDIAEDTIKLEEVEQMISPVAEQAEKISDRLPEQSMAEPAQAPPRTIAPEVKKASDSLFNEDNIEDYLFEIKPLDRKKLEQEIKPLFESIQATRELTPEPAKKTTPVEPDSGKKFPSPAPSQDEKPAVVPDRTAFEKEKMADAETDRLFVDEALIQQSAQVKKQSAAKAPMPVEPTVAAAKADELDLVPQFAPLPNGQQDKIILISVDDDCKDELMEILTDDNFKSLKLNDSSGIQIDIGKFKNLQQTEMKIIAVSLQKKLDQFLQSIRPTVFANLFTFDCSRPETWEYTYYLISSISDKYPIPGMLAVFNSEENEQLNVEVIRYKLKLDEAVPIIYCAETDKTCKARLLNTLVELGAKKAQPKKIETEKVEPSVMR